MSYIYAGPYLLVVSAPTQVETLTRRRCSKEGCSKKKEPESPFCPACGSKVITETYEEKYHPSYHVVDEKERLMDMALNRDKPQGPRKDTVYLHLVPNHKDGPGESYRIDRGSGFFEVKLPSEVEKAEEMVALDRYTEEGGLRKTLEETYESVETRWGIFHYTFD